MINGWLNFYKKAGISSAYLVSLCKSCVEKGTKIGHAGTLDKEAEGILPIAIGKATKLIKFLLQCKKSYIFKVQFGAKTDTGDFSGKFVEFKKFIPSFKHVQNACKNFVGNIVQTPPRYSAIKIKGVRSYKLARQNINFEIIPKLVKIHRFFCLNFNEKEGVATFFLECGSGTYVRSLAQDLAEYLSSLCFVKAIQRISVGNFCLEQSLDSHLLQDKKKRFLFKENLVYCLLSPEYALDNAKFFLADDSQLKLIAQGMPCSFIYADMDYNLVFIRFQEDIIAFGSLVNKIFIPSRVLV
ncbi:MAG: tRNA pseudouridine(55) synthase TruB [Rickettsia sp.]|nr:tRNA pseudouridine(55) synthase TruB [Rickettsia sp.]